MAKDNHYFVQEVVPNKNFSNFRKEDGLKIPKLRFPGYTYAWELQSLADVVSKEIKGKAKAEMLGTESKYLETTYLNGGKPSYVDAPTDVKDDDVIILWDGSQAGTVYHGFSGALGSTFKAYTPKISGEFLFQQLKRNQELIYEKYRTPNIPHVVKTFSKDFKIFVTEYDEQIKIAEFFKNIDELVTLHQRKLEDLKLQKQGLLQKMFPKASESVPELRFSGYTYAWEPRFLGEITDIKTGSGDLQDAVPNGKYPFFVRSENVERSNHYIFDGEAILIPGEGKLGDIYHYINGKFDFHQRVYKVSGFENSHTFGKFILYSMESNFKRHAMKYTVKATVDSLRLPTLTNFEIMLPKYEEQVKIADFFAKIDELVTLHQRKLNHLQEQKKALLQQMFI